MRLHTTLPLLASLASAGFINTLQRIVTASSTTTTQAASWSYTNCGTSTDAITLNSLTLSPDPPVPGSPLSATIDFTANSRIVDGAYIELAVKAFGISLYSRTVDLCDEEGLLKNTGVGCPIEEGQYVFTKEVELPAEIPTLSYTVEVEGYTAEEGDMFCVEVKADFSSASVAKVGL